MNPLDLFKRLQLRERLRKIRPRHAGYGLLLLLVAPLLIFPVIDDWGDYRHPSAAPLDGLVSLDQGWSARESAWFYSISQGSDLLPYDIFVSLADAGAQTPFLSAGNVERWRYIGRPKSASNPDGLPIGWARDEYQGHAYVGFTCAACHTARIDIKGTSLLVDGGPAMADMETFINDLDRAIDSAAQFDEHGSCASDACKALVQSVLQRGNYANERAVQEDLQTWRRKIDAYAAINDASRDGAPTYGYARLDAFGRIFNRVLEHVMQRPQLESLLPLVFDGPGELEAVRKELAPALNSGPDDHIVERALALLTPAQGKRLVAGLFNPPDAPVSYPFLWDTSQHDYVQWNGLASNGSLGPVGRNSGEVEGVFGTLDWKMSSRFDPLSGLSGQGFHREHVAYQSSIRVHNLRRIESQISRLQSPRWPSDKVKDPSLQVDAKKAAAGQVLFGKHCAGCHQEIEARSPDRRVIADLESIDRVGTDATMASNSVTRTGHSGILRNQYVDVLGVGKTLLNQKAPVASLLTQTTTGVVASPYPDDNYFRRYFNWVSDLAHSYFENRIEDSLRQGSYAPSTTSEPYAPLMSYKGRSLNGIWATAPYLHNGSVPTLYDLLLPAARDKNDPARTEYRTAKFRVGSRELDPLKVGFQSTEEAGGFLFDTSQPGNSNRGHEYATIHDKRPGAVPLTEDQRWELVEYLKVIGDRP